MTTSTRTLIIGTGFAGVGLGTKLKRSGDDDFLIVDRSNDVGGTWRDNRYPGAACDVPSHLYSFSFRLKSDWSRVFSPATEIWEYVVETAREEGLMPHIRLGCELISADWNDETQRWLVTTTGGDFDCQVLVTAMGHLADGKYPNIPGLKDFTGHLMHSAQWDHSVDLTGKRIAVIGSGASAIQITPAMGDIAGELVVFQRTAPYVIPRPDRAYTDAEKRMFARSPEMMEELRSEVFWGLEYNYAQRRGMPRAIAEAYAMANGHRNNQVTDPVLNAKLTPDYEIGCKRVLISDVYYPTFAKPHVTLEASALERVEGNTVFSADGNSYEVDAIVCATGFEAIEPPFAPLIHGKDGQTLAGHWDQGMQAYQSITVPGFPNLFITNGPNTGLGHNSVLFVVESQIEHIQQALRYLEESDASSLEALPQAEEGYLDWVRHRSEGTVWLDGGCSNWYVDPRTNRLTVTWPDYAYAFRTVNGDFTPESYNSLVAGGACA